MGQHHSAPATTASARASTAAPAESRTTYQVRVLEGGKEHPRHLHYIDPEGRPVWTSKHIHYVDGVPSFEAAQRICRQIMIQPEYVQGTRVQFFQNHRRIKHSTVLKPAA